MGKLSSLGKSNCNNLMLYEINIFDKNKLEANAFGCEENLVDLEILNLKSAIELHR